jgi:hypothetical protein
MLFYEKLPLFSTGLFEYGYPLDLLALTPGDFFVVKNKAAILGVYNPAELAELLAREQDAKGVTKNDRIGF